VARSKPTVVSRATSPRSAESQLSCVGRCSNYCVGYGAGSVNCNAGNDDYNTDRNRRLPIGRTQDDGLLSTPRSVSQDKNVMPCTRPTRSRIPVPCLSRTEPPSRLDRPVNLYASSMLPVPVRPGLAPARIPRNVRTCGTRPPWDVAIDADSNAVDDNGIVVVPGQLDNRSLTGLQPPRDITGPDDGYRGSRDGHRSGDSNDGLSDATDRQSLQYLRSGSFACISDAFDVPSRARSAPAAVGCGPLRRPHA